MATYRVVYKQVEYLHLDVEANSPEEAREIAENTDGSEFIDDGTSFWWEYCCTEDENGVRIDG